MNLNFPLLDDSIPLKNMTILALEHPEVFSKITYQIYEYNDSSEIKIYDKKYNALKESDLLVVMDILGYSLNSASVLKLIYSDLEKQISDDPELKTHIERLSIELNELIKIETFSHDLLLSTGEPTLLELLKMFNVKIDTQYTNIFEKCLEIIQLFTYLPKKKLLVFVNVCSFFTLDEIQILNEEVSLHNVKVLFIEPRQVYNVSQYVMDSDFCLIKR